MYRKKNIEPYRFARFTITVTGSRKNNSKSKTVSSFFVVSGHWPMVSCLVGASNNAFHSQLMTSHSKRCSPNYLKLKLSSRLLETEPSNWDIWTTLHRTTLFAQTLLMLLFSSRHRRATAAAAAAASAQLDTVFLSTYRTKTKLSAKCEPA